MLLELVLAEPRQHF